MNDPSLLKLSDEQLMQLPRDILVQMIRVLTEKIEKLELRIAKLEKNSSNSSKPPSTDINRPTRRKPESLREKSGRKQGGQKGHKGKTLLQSNHPDHIVPCEPEGPCPCCGQTGFSEENPAMLERRQAFDIPQPRYEVTEYRKIGRKCKCGHYRTGQFPETVSASVQFGNRIRAFMVYLNTAQMIPFDRLSRMAEELFGLPVSKRSIQKMLEQVSGLTEPVHQQIMKWIKSGNWIGSDETGTRINGKKYYQWVWQNPNGVYFAIGDRSYEMITNHLGEDYSGTVISDRNKSQLKTKAGNGHQICLPHIFRELKFLNGKWNCKWAGKLKVFLKQAIRFRDKIWISGYDPGKRNRIISKFEKRLKKLLADKPVLSDSVKLMKELAKIPDSIIRFMKSPDIPWHNNSSEQSFRIAKVKLKVSGGFRTSNGSTDYCKIMSVIETAKRYSVPPLIAIQNLLAGLPVFQVG